jgi:hypothetical protein
VGFSTRFPDFSSPQAAEFFSVVSSASLIQRGFGERNFGLMAFGRRSTTANGTGVQAKRSRKNAGAAVAENKVFGGPMIKFTDMRAASGRRMSVVGATIGEKMAHFGANMRLGFYVFVHPLHPIRRVAARESATNKKLAATERKKQKIARAIDVEYRKRAGAREGRAANLNKAL